MSEQEIQLVKNSWNIAFAVGAVGLNFFIFLLWAGGHLALNGVK